MTGFVRSDLVVFGSAILLVMMLILGIIFRRVRWVVIPLVTCSATVEVMLGLLGAWRLRRQRAFRIAGLYALLLYLAMSLVTSFILNIYNRRIQLIER